MTSQALAWKLHEDSALTAAALGTHTNRFRNLTRNDCAKVALVDHLQHAQTKNACAISCACRPVNICFRMSALRKYRPCPFNLSRKNYMCYFCSLKLLLLRYGACDLTILDIITRAKSETSFLSSRSLHISRHRHDVRDEHALLLQCSIAVAVIRCLHPYSCRHYQARENRKIGFVSPKPLHLAPAPRRT